jgi:hypothetical protein
MKFRSSALVVLSQEQIERNRAARKDQDAHVTSFRLYQLDKEFNEDVDAFEREELEIYQLLD